MPALHVIGEILGASGLAHEHALSLSHVLDLLALDASSKRSFFCCWRLLFNTNEQDDDSAYDGGAPSAAWSSTWEVVHGDQHGQTQVHSPSASLSIPLSCGSGNGEPESAECASGDHVLLDVVWNHPLDLHVATSVALAEWPHLELEVWSFDTFNQIQLCGAARICIPSASKEHFLDVPLVRRVPNSWLERVAASLSISSVSVDGSAPEGAANFEQRGQPPLRTVAEDEEHPELVEAAGTVFLRIAVLQNGF